MSKDMFAQLTADIEAAQDVTGVLMSDVILLPDTLRSLINFITREKLVSVAETAEFLDQDEDHTRSVVSELVRKGYLEVVASCGQVYYRVRTHTLVPRNPRKDLLRLFDEPEEKN